MLRVNIANHNLPNSEGVTLWPPLQDSSIKH